MTIRGRTRPDSLCQRAGQQVDGVAGDGGEQVSPGRFGAPAAATVRCDGGSERWAGGGVVDGAQMTRVVGFAGDAGHDQLKQRVAQVACGEDFSFDDLQLGRGAEPGPANPVGEVGGRVQHLIAAEWAGAAGGQQFEAEGAGVEPVGGAGVRTQLDTPRGRHCHVTSITSYMTVNWKVVVDTTDATSLAGFWAAALDYTVEDPTILINRLLTAGHLGEDSIVEHHGRRTFRGFAGIRHPDDPYDETSGVGHGRRLLFQDVPEPKTGKNRLHLDIHSGPAGLADTVARLEALGAERVCEVDKGPAGHWWVMRDPEGNEFCVA